MKKKLRIALVGCGDISENYALSFKELERTELVKVMDVDINAARRLGENHGIAFTDSFDDILGDKSIDTVVISVPHYLHKSLAVQAAEAGKNVLLDKPIATTVADGEEIIRVCKRKKVRLAINFPRRGFEGTQVVRTLLRRGVIGEVRMVKIAEFVAKPATYWTKGGKGLVTTDWRGNKRKSGGGYFIMNISHTLDVVRYVTGFDVVSVCGAVENMDTPQVEVEDVGAAVLRFSNGAFGTIAAGSAFPGAAQEPLRILGTHGQIVWEKPLQVYTVKKASGLKKGAWTEIDFDSRYRVRRRGVMGPQYGGFLAMCEEAILKNKPMPCTGEDGLQVLKVVLGLYEAGKSGKTVRIK